jgi:hypothetical protein
VIIFVYGTSAEAIKLAPLARRLENKGVEYEQWLTMFHGSSLRESVKKLGFNDRQEVIPGAAAALYGHDAMAGAVSLRLKRPRGNSALAECSGGSFASSRELVSITRQNRESGGIRFSAENSQDRKSVV